MNKFSMKYKYKVGEEVILKDHPHPGWCTFTTVEEIRVEIHEHYYNVYYILHHGCGDHKYREGSIESVAEFNERHRQDKRNYKSYVEWLNTHDFTKKDD